MLKNRPIVQFFISVALIYALLTLFASTVGKIPYRNALYTTGNFLYSSHPVDSITFLENKTKDRHKNDSRILLINKKSVDQARKVAREQGKTNVKVNARDITYNSYRFILLPIILVLTLILATPIFPIIQRFYLAAWGFLIIHIYVLFKLFIWISKTSTNFGASSPMWKSIVKFNHKMFIADSPMRWIIPLFIWLALVARKIDWKPMAAAINQQIKKSSLPAEK